MLAELDRQQTGARLRAAEHLAGTEERVLALHTEMSEKVKSLPWRKDMTSNVSLRGGAALPRI